MAFLLRYATLKRSLENENQAHWVKKKLNQFINRNILALKEKPIGYFILILRVKHLKLQRYYNVNHKLDCDTRQRQVNAIFWFKY